MIANESSVVRLIIDESQRIPETEILNTQISHCNVIANFGDISKQKSLYIPKNKIFTPWDLGLPEPVQGQSPVEVHSASRRAASSATVAGTPMCTCVLSA